MGNSVIASAFDLNGSQSRQHQASTEDTSSKAKDIDPMKALGGDILLFNNSKNSAGSNSDRSELRHREHGHIGVLIEADTESGKNIQAATAKLKATGGNLYAVAIKSNGVDQPEPSLRWKDGQLVLTSDNLLAAADTQLAKDSPAVKGVVPELNHNKVAATGSRPHKLP